MKISYKPDWEWTKLREHGMVSRYHSWVSGIYKIVSYEDDGTKAGKYLAFYLPDHLNNWGDFVSDPPIGGKRSGYWPKLWKAIQACEAHAINYTPAKATVKRAEYLLQRAIEKEFSICFHLNTSVTERDY